MKQRIAQVFNNRPTPFVVRKGEIYKIVTLGYIDKDNPSGDAIINPSDLDKVTITQLGKLPDGSLVLSAQHKCRCGVNIEIFDK